MCVCVCVCVCVYICICKADYSVNVVYTLACVCIYWRVGRGTYELVLSALTLYFSSSPSSLELSDTKVYEP